MLNFRFGKYFGIINLLIVISTINIPIQIKEHIMEIIPIPNSKVPLFKNSFSFDGCVLDSNMKYIPIKDKVMYM